MERHAFRPPFSSSATHPIGGLSAMAFLVGVMRRDGWRITPTRSVQRLSPAFVRVEGLVMAGLNRGRIALPRQGGGKSSGS